MTLDPPVKGVSKLVLDWPCDLPITDREIDILLNGFGDLLPGIGSARRVDD